VVADGQGNATIGWLQAQGIWSGVRAVRYTRSTAAFGEMVEVAPTYPYLPLLWMTADPGGAATAVWQHHDGTDVIVQSARWEPTPAAPVIAWATVEPGALRLSVTRPADREPAFTATNYEYSTDDGATWVPRVPPSTASPLDISGLPGGASTLRLRAVNRAGPGRRSASYPVTLGPAPAAPVNLAVRRVAGDVVTVGWTQPNGVTQPDGYVLEGGSAPGGVIVRIPTGGTAPAFTFTSPRGVYYVRLRAFTGASFSPPSNDIPLVVAVDLPPSPPMNLLAVVNGSTLALSWTNTNTGGSPTAMRLDVTGTWTGAIPLVPSEGFAAGGIPAGTYTMTVTAMNAAGFSAPSNAVTVQLPGACSGPPAAPRNLAAGANGRRIQVLWDAPSMGPAVTGYDVMVTGPFAATVHTLERMVSGDVTPGLYSIRVIATNPCGPSAPTPSRSVTVY
jgi:hypothetical protein